MEIMMITLIEFPSEHKNITACELIFYVAYIESDDMELVVWIVMRDDCVIMIVDAEWEIMAGK